MASGNRGEPLAVAKRLDCKSSSQRYQVADTSMVRCLLVRAEKNHL